MDSYNLDRSAEELCTERKKAIQKMIQLSLAMLKFFSNLGWDFMTEYEKYLDALSELFWTNIDADDFYDDDGKYLFFQFIEYIIKRWDPDIQCLMENYLAKTQFDDGSKQQQVPLSSKYYSLLLVTSIISLLLVTSIISVNTNVFITRRFYI